MLIIKRDPVTIGAVLVALVALVGHQLGWSIELTGSICAAITAAVGVVQSLNVFGTDQFVAIAINLVAAVLTVYTAWSGIPISDEFTSLLFVLITVVLGMFVRNGVTNRFGPSGLKVLRPDAGPTSTVVHQHFASDPPLS